VNCPHCGRTFDPLRGQKYCSYCGRELTAQDVESKSSSPDRPSGDRKAKAASRASLSDDGNGPYCAWEDIEHLGFFQALLLTIKQSLFGSASFFLLLPKRGGLLNPLLYALIVEATANMAGYLSGMAVENPLFPQVQLSGGLMIMIGALIPLGALLWVFIWSVLLHVSLLLVGGANEDFEASFRVVSYSSAADLFNIVPLVGWLIAPVWKLYLLVVGVREVHRTGTGRAAAAVILPALFCCGIVGIAVLIGLIGMSVTAH
jgi:hypothetical protein